ncbi:MAG TPA: CHRD domain-containing protein [Chitinophagaceae bacterium]|nr:CHRD domain-containing protein [Chitinophagaceae bacterium]
MKKGTFIFSALLIVIAFTAVAFKPVQSNNVVWTQLVQMDATQAGSTSESKGFVIFRLTSDMELTYKITVQNTDDGDVLTNAHIHTGAAGVDGPPVIFLAAGVANINRFQTVQLTTVQYNLLLNENQSLYVNVHSHDYPGDSIRGQIR